MNTKPAAQIASDIMGLLNISPGEMPLRKAYLRSIVDRIEDDNDVIRILAREAGRNKMIALSSVRSFEQKWRATTDESANTYHIERER